MAKAYFINSTPTPVKIVLNGGDQKKLDPISVNTAGDAVSGPAWAAAIAANKGENVFGGNDDDNEITFSSEQSGKQRKYSIKSSVSTVLDLYFFMFEDMVVGEDQTGSSAGITIVKTATIDSEL